MSSQARVFEKLIEFLNNIDIPFTLPTHEQTKLLVTCCLEASPPPKIVNAVSLGDLIQFLAEYFNLFFGKVADLKQFVRSL
jgi:hypothetical protein